jgi:hypothetical protein
LVPLGTGTLLCTRAGKGRLTDVGNPAWWICILRR